MKSYARPNHGHRTNGSEPIRRHAAHIIGMMLAQAFAATKPTGFKLHVATIDSIEVAPHRRNDELNVHLDVDVERGVVTKAKLS